MRTEAKEVVGGERRRRGQGLSFGGPTLALALD